MNSVRNPVIQKNLGIRYVKLQFTARFLCDAQIPKYKTSALRGGMGEMLLLANCVRDEYRYRHADHPNGNPCEECEFEEECLVRRILYSEYMIRPPFVPQGESAGYLFECEDYRMAVGAGDTLSFNMLLFGRTIVFLNPILQALYMLGNAGLGKAHARFEITEVRNQFGEPVMREGNVYKKNYRTQTVLDYVNYRLRHPASGSMTVRTPMTLKYNGEELRRFDAEAFLRAVCRRIYMLDSYEGIETESMRGMLELPEIREQHAIRTEVPRYSGTRNQYIYLHGIRGNILWEHLTEETYAVFLAGELLHIGKNVTFGFGKYVFRDE